MNWQKICDNPQFNDLPFKFETNEWGKIEMCPASNEHSLYQMLIIEWLIRLAQNGKPLPECSIQTRKGVKVADVAWASFDFFKRNKRSNPYLESPEVVIEILSPSNTRAEMDLKNNSILNKVHKNSGSVIKMALCYFSSQNNKYWQAVLFLIFLIALPLILPKFNNPN
jgi:hypothetical protein